MNHTPDRTTAPDTEIDELLERLDEAAPADAADTAEGLAERLSARIETTGPDDDS